ncbi:MAG: hypothetical protein IJR99_10480 [Kiritimatiellae bacterium]|nr:hypothetical protein [Kiritimatiellia bacterium]
MLSNVGDSVLTIDNSTVTVTASNGLHPNGNGPDGINVGSQNALNGKGKAKIDIKNGSVVTATGNANGVNLFTWGDDSSVNACGAELSVVDSTLNASATDADHGAYGIVTYAYQKGDTAVRFENSTINASANETAGICLGAGDAYNDKVGNLSLVSVDSAITTSGPYGLIVSSVSDVGTNTDAEQIVSITDGTFTSDGMVYVLGDGDDTASITMSGVTAMIESDDDEGNAAITTGTLNIDSGRYTINYDDQNSFAFDVANGNVSGGNFNMEVPEEICADGYIPREGVIETVGGVDYYTVKVGSYVAQIGDEKYETFAEAIAAVPTDGTETTITMIADETIAGNNGVTVGANQNVVLDLAGHTVELAVANAGAQAYLIQNNGTLTVTDSATGGRLFTNGEGMGGNNVKCVIQNNGQVTVNGGTIAAKSTNAAGDAYGTAHAISCQRPTANVSVTIDGGTLTAEGGATALNLVTSSAVFMLLNNDSATAAFTMTDGTLIASGSETSSAVNIYLPNKAAAQATVNISGGELNGVREALYIHGGSTIDYQNVSTTISGGTFTGFYEPEQTTEMALNVRAGSLTVTGGTFNYGSYLGSHQIDISGGNFTEDVILYREGGTADANISGGTFGGDVIVGGTAGSSTIDADKNLYAEGKFVSGGNFANEVPEELCAEGYIPTTTADPETGLYTVKTGAFVARNVDTDVGYETLYAAVAAATAGDTVTLLTNVTESLTISKDLTLMGDWTITGTTRFDARANVTISNLTFDANGVIYAMNIAGGSAVDLQNVTVGGGQWCNIHVNNGTLTGSGVAMTGDQIVVAADGQTYTYRGETYAASEAPWGLDVTKVPGQTLNVPYMDIVRENGTDTITLSDSEEKQLTQAGSILYLANMPEDTTLTGVTLPERFCSYTLTLDADIDFFGGAEKPVTGWAVGDWNEILDTGATVLEALDENPAEVPVELELNNDVDLGDGDNGFEFRYPNLTIDGNGNAVSGTIKYTDDAGVVSNIVLGTESAPLTLDMTGVTNPIELGSGVAVSNVTINMTAEQATAGTPIIIWDAENADAPANESGVTVELVDAQGTPTGDTADLIWDDELGVAYIGPCEARLTGPTHETPVYTTLANAIALAEQSGDTIMLMTNIVNFTGTQDIAKQDLVIDGAGYSITAAPVSTHRDVVHAWAGSTSMFKLQTGDITFRNITLDGDATHAYTFLISADNSSVHLTTENIKLLNGGELCGDANGDVLEEGAGYGAAIHINNGAAIVVSNGFYACTGGEGETIPTGVFPFTGILVDENGGDVKFELTGNPNDPANVDIGNDLLLVGMPIAIDLDNAQDMLDYMKVPSRFIPYTLTLGDGDSSSFAHTFTGASPLGWNDIIDYGKDIMEVSTAMGYEGLDTDSTPVEVGLLTDTVLPDIFRFADTNFTVNGNGNALSGTIEYTDDAGTLMDIVLGTEEAPLTLDLTDLTGTVHLGADVDVANVTLVLTPEQATSGHPVFTWGTDDDVDGPQHENVTIMVSDSESDAQLIWDAENGVAFIGPCEARLSGPTHETPIYTTLLDALNRAADSGDTVTLLTNITANVTIGKSLTLNGGYTLTGRTKVTDGAVVAISNLTFDAAGDLYALDIAGGAAVGVSDATFGGGVWCNVHINEGALTGSGVTMFGDQIAVAADGQTFTYRGETLDASAAPFGMDLDNVKGQTVTLPFMDIVRENGTETVNLSDTAEHPLVQTGSLLFVANMPGNDTQTGVTLPARFYCYTLTIEANIGFLGDGTTPTTGWTLGEWNDIIDTGSAVLDAIGEESETVPVTLELNNDLTVIPGTFEFRNENLTIDGNGNSLAGTIEYTPNAGILQNATLGTEETPLTIDMTEMGNNSVRLGDDIGMENVEVVLTAAQAEAGHIVFQWGDDVTPPTGADDVTVHVQGDDSPVELIWDTVENVAYVGPGVDLDSYDGISQDTATLVNTWIHIFSNQRYFMDAEEGAGFAAGNTIPEAKGVAAYIFNDRTLTVAESVDYQLGISSIKSDSATQIRVKIRLLVKGVPFEGKINGVINLLGKESVADTYAPLDGQKQSDVTFTSGESQELKFTVPSGYQVFNPVITLE